MKRIGILRGTENTFPEALIAFINHAYSGADVHAEFVSLDSVSLDGEPAYDVILDRISPDVPFYRSYLKWVALRGTYVVNNPFWWGADDKFVGHVIARQLGVAVPRTVLLPHKQPPPSTQPTSFRNLHFPIDWPAVFAHVGFPAFLKPHESGNRRGVTKVRNPQEFFAAYDASGTTCMMLQESIEFEDYFRCYCIGRSEVHHTRYNPAVPHDQRYNAVSRGPIPTSLRHRLERDVGALANALGYDVNCVDFAVRGGVPYAVDVINPVPDADRHSVGEANFDWVMRNTAALLVSKAEEKRSSQYVAQRTLVAQAPARRLEVVAKPPQGRARPAKPAPSMAEPQPSRVQPAPGKLAPRPAKPEAKPAKVAPAMPTTGKPKPSAKPSRPTPVSRPAPKTPPPKADAKAAKLKVKAVKPSAKAPKPPTKPATKASPPRAGATAAKGGVKGAKPSAKAPKQPAKPAARRTQPAKPGVKPAKPAPKATPKRAKPPAKKAVGPPKQVAKKVIIAKRVGAKSSSAKAKTRVAKPKAVVPKAKRPPAKPLARAKHSTSRVARRR
jgi:glutathione synthase/RimK-type ligase-like ATP-grasp enzyme